MSRLLLTMTVAALALAGACATPEVAEDYETRVFVPEELMAALAGEDPAARADAGKQVETMAPDRRREVLLELTWNESPAVRLLAVGLLAKHHATEEAVVARLAEVLSLDGDADVRTAAIGGLAKSGRPEGLRAIYDALEDDPSLFVKRTAANTLDRLTGRSFGGEFAGTVDEAEMAADDAMMAYEEWLDENEANLRWDAAQGKFVGGAR